MYQLIVIEPYQHNGEHRFLFQKVSPSQVRGGLCPVVSGQLLQRYLHTAHLGGLNDFIIEHDLSVFELPPLELGEAICHGNPGFKVKGLVFTVCGLRLTVLA
jgi:hypothetical protein